MDLPIGDARIGPAAAQATLIEHTIEAIYDAAVDPACWPRAMRGVRSLFRTEAEALYSLDNKGRTKEVFQIDGIGSGAVRDFESAFYTPDNPWTISPELALPGVIRTDETLCEYFNSGDVLVRSCYYNEWMRPQRLRHTIGTTLAADDGCELNFTLLRPTATGPFTATETRRFGDLTNHLRRATRLARRLGTVTAGRGLAAQALDALRHGVVLLNDEGGALHANRAAEALFARGGVRLQGGRIVAAGTAENAQLAVLVRHLGKRSGGEANPHPGPVLVNNARGKPVWVSGVRLSDRHRGFLGARPVVLLTIVDPRPSRTGTAALLERLYHLNRTETRIVQALLVGQGLREAADAARITYETARTYLKSVFQKTQTSRQAELVARILGDVTAVEHGAIGGTG